MFLCVHTSAFDRVKHEYPLNFSFSGCSLRQQFTSRSKSNEKKVKNRLDFKIWAYVPLRWNCGSRSIKIINFHLRVFDRCSAPSERGLFLFIWQGLFPCFFRLKWSWTSHRHARKPPNNANTLIRHTVQNTSTNLLKESHNFAIHPSVRCDMLGKLCHGAQLFIYMDIWNPRWLCSSRFAHESVGEWKKKRCNQRETFTFNLAKRAILVKCRQRHTRAPRIICSNSMEQRNNH